MPLIRRRRIPLPLKHMPQMPSTIRTNNLRPRHPKRRIRMSDHSTRDTVEIGGPSATRFELVGSAVEWGGTGGAGVGACCGGVFVVGAGVGGFGAFSAEDAELFCPEMWLVCVLCVCMCVCGLLVKSARALREGGGRGGEGGWIMGNRTYLYSKRPATHYPTS